MTRKFDGRTVAPVLIFVLLFLAGMNFCAKFFYYCFACLPIFVLFRGKLRINAASVWYLALGLFMAVCNRGEGSLSMLRCFAPFLCYLLGVNLTLDAPTRPDSSPDEAAQMQTHRLILVMATGTLCHFVLNCLYNFGTQTDRNANDIWTGVSMSATAQAGFASLSVGAAVAALLRPAKKHHRIVALAVLALIFYYDLTLAARTPLALALLTAAVGIFLCFVQSGKLVLRPKKLLFFALTVLCVVLLYHFDAFGIRRAIESSALAARFDQSQGFLWDNSLRNHAKRMYLQNLLAYPFGGLHLRSRFGYAHDLLLDGFDEYGLIALLLLLAILCDGAIGLWRHMRRKTARRTAHLTLVLVYLTMLTEFALEPILEGMPWLFSFYCLLNGCLYGMHAAHIAAQQEETAR